MEINIVKFGVWCKPISRTAPGENRNNIGMVYC